MERRRVVLLQSFREKCAIRVKCVNKTKIQVIVCIRQVVGVIGAEITAIVGKIHQCPGHANERVGQVQIMSIIMIVTITFYIIMGCFINSTFINCRISYNQVFANIH